MSGFGFSEAQEMFRRQVRDFALKELAPGVKERAKQKSPDRQALKRLGEMGLIGLSLPQKYGGQEAEFVMLGISVEELAKVDFHMGFFQLGLSLIGLILQDANEELRQRWLTALIKGEETGSVCLTEPDCGSDAGAIRTAAIRDGDDYIITGEKTCISLAMEAKIGAVFAKTNPAAKVKGISCFLVPLDSPGVEKSQIHHMGIQCAVPAIISFNGVRVNAQNLIGEEGKGFHLIMNRFDFSRAAIGLAALGQAQTSIQEAIDYSLQRVAFGRPIAKFEGVSFKIADHTTTIEAARWLCYRTLWLRDQGLPHNKESAMCKWFCPQVAVKAIHDAMMIHGHVGYSQEYLIEQRLRDVIGLELADGSADIMKLIVVREVMGEEALPY